MEVISLWYLTLSVSWLGFSVSPRPLWRSSFLVDRYLQKIEAMDLFGHLEPLSRGTVVAAVVLSYAIYLIGVAVYRLYLSPIAKFPGPKLAALSKWYELYYDVILKGQFSAHITELHKIYGEPADHRS